MLRLGHDAGRELLGKAGFNSGEIEAVEVAEMVEAHRWAWKPKRVRLLLMAESHVYTATEELAFDYGGAHYFPRDLNAPSRYVRLIYCLGYGERLLAPAFNGGTPQFWGIFGDLCGTQPKHSIGAPRHERLAEKLRTLHLLAERGVWLADASFHGVSRRNGARLDGKTAGLLQRQWWANYGRSIVERERPERIVAIGKGVYSSMKDYVQFDRWIYQPQGVRRPEQKQHNDEVLRELRSWLESKRQA